MSCPYWSSFSFVSVKQYSFKYYCWYPIGAQYRLGLLFANDSKAACFHHFIFFVWLKLYVIAAFKIGDLLFHSNVIVRDGFHGSHTSVPEPKCQNPFECHVSNVDILCTSIIYTKHWHFSFYYTWIFFCPRGNALI